MLTAYIKAAMKRAKYESFEENGRLYHYAEIPELPGTYGCASTLQKCEHDLRSAIADRVALCTEERIPLPTFDGESVEFSPDQREHYLNKHVFTYDVLTKGEKVLQVPNLEQVPGALIERILKSAGITHEEWEGAR